MQRQEVTLVLGLLGWFGQERAAIVQDRDYVGVCDKYTCKALHFE